MKMPQGKVLGTFRNCNRNCERELELKLQTLKGQKNRFIFSIMWLTSWFSWQNRSSISYWAENSSSFEACSKCKNQNKKLVIWLLVVTQFLKRHMSFFRPRYLLGPNSSLSPPKKRFKNSSLFRSHISLIDLDLGAKLLHLVWKECTYIFPKISNVAFLEKMWKVKEKIFLYST